MKKDRIAETDLYDGTLTAKTRLLNLFLYTDLNIKEFCSASEKYRKYIVKTLNTIHEDQKKDNLPNYTEICNRVLGITEIDNILEINRMFFNTLISFDSFISYIFNYKTHKWVDNTELKDVIDIFTISFEARMIDNDLDFDLHNLLHETRNTLVHNGKFVSKFAQIPNGKPNVKTPAIVIIPSEIFNSEYCKKHNIAKDYVIDTYEIFSHFLEVFDKVYEFIKKLV